MSKGLKVAIGVVAAIAIPFVAPMIAGAIGASTLFAGTALGGFLAGAGGSALVGAGLGAASAAATGRNPLLGAALGGVGGFAGGGGFSGLFGGGAAGTGAAGAAASAPAPVVGAGALAPVPAAMTAGAPLQLAGGIGGAAATAPTAGFSLASLGSSLASSVNPSNLAQLALVMYGNSNTDQLDAARQATLRETAELASRDRGLFEQRVDAARKVMQQAEANPQTAYAQTAMSVERRLQEAQRGAPAATQEANMRRAGIEAARLGTAAAQGENTRSASATQAAASMLPTQAPLGYAGRVLPIYEAMQRREDEQMRDIARAVGGATGGTRQAGLFSLPA